MAVCHLPFDDPEEGYEDEGFDEDTDYGEEDTYDEFDEFEEEDDTLQASVKKSVRKAVITQTKHGIKPQRQYLKVLSQDQYDKVIGKDAYAFLHGHEDEVVMALSVGKDVSDDFKTLSATDVRDVYWIIIEEIEKRNWSSKRMVEKLMEAYPMLKKYEAERIIRTEVTRVINYAKEMIATREDLGEYNYGWMGPLDYRTTPMCYYLQTGTLRDTDIKALEKVGRTPSDLPPIPEEGMPLEVLRQTVRDVAEAFGYDMISDWVPHINCRHTFARGNKRLDVEIAEPSEIDRVIEDLIDTAPGGGEEPQVVMEPIVEQDKALFTVYDDYDSYIFVNSIYHVPTMYNNPKTDDIFVFEEMNEKDVASWARLIIQLREEGINDAVIVWAIQDTGRNIEDNVIGYMMTHADEILDRAEHEGWLD